MRSLNLLRVQDLSALLKVSKSSLYEWVSLGQIPFVKINGAVRFRPGEIEAWLESCAQGPRPLPSNAAIKAAVKEGFREFRKK